MTLCEITEKVIHVDRELRLFCTLCQMFQFDRVCFQKGEASANFGVSNNIICVSNARQDYTTPNLRWREKATPYNSQPSRLQFTTCFVDVTAVNSRRYG